MNETLPYQCVCCGKRYADPSGEGSTSYCWPCIGQDVDCANCRANGIFISDFRVGRWPKDLGQPYDPEGGLGHRLESLDGDEGVMHCGVRIPRAHFGGGSAVKPGCPICWPEGA